MTAFLSAWTTLVRDDGNGLGFFMVILAAVVGAFAARFRPDGMARALLGTAAMQVLLSIGVATAPSVAAVSGGSFRILIASGGLAMLWLLAAGCFQIAAKRRAGAPAVP